MIRALDPLSLKKIADAELNAKIDGIPSLADQVLKKISHNGAYFIVRSRVPMGVISETNEMGTFEKDKFSPAYNKTYHIKKYGMAAQISEEMLDDNKSDFNYASEIGKAFKEGAAYFHDLAAADLFNYAVTDSAAYHGLDAKPLLSTTHDASYYSQSNRLAVDADISESTIESLRHLASSLTDMRGKRGILMMDTLISHVDNREEIDRILGSSLRPATSDNDKNVNRSIGDIKRIITSPHLTDTDATYIMTNHNDDHGLFRVDLRPLRIRVIPDELTESFIYICSERSLTAWGNWRCMLGTVGAA